MPANPNLESLSIPDLQTLIADAQKALASKVNAERAELQRKLQELDAIAAPPASSEPRKRSASNYTHVHPKNGHRWLGRGSTPKEWQDIITEDMTKEQRAAELAKHRVTA